MIELIRKSVDMKKCPISDKCGSCHYINIPYEEQLSKKKEYCLSLLQETRLSKIKVRDVQGMSNPYHYRNKIIVSFNQKYQYGFYEEESHKIIPYQKCLLHEEESDLIIQKIQSLLKKYKVSIYDEKSGYGLVRHILIRRAVKTNQTMVVLVCNEGVFKGSKNFCNELIRNFPSIKTVVLNVNKRKTSIVLGQEEKVLYGKGFIVDKLCGLSFKISSRSFYQVNHDQCERLYQMALSLLKITGNEVVVDAYCGIGTIGMVLAGKVKEVIGVENNKAAVEDARNNAKYNEINNISFVCEDATDYLVRSADMKQKVDIVIMDPPRNGSSIEFKEAIQKLSPKQVLYISCEPKTLVRDMEYFKKLGYEAEMMYPYDMFPQTKHIECVTLLSGIK